MAEIGGFNEITLIFVGWAYMFYNRNKFGAYLKFRLYGGEKKAAKSVSKVQGEYTAKNTDPELDSLIEHEIAESLDIT